MAAHRLRTNTRGPESKALSGQRVPCAACSLVGDSLLKTLDLACSVAPTSDLWVQQAMHVAANVSAECLGVCCGGPDGCQGTPT